MFFLVRVYRDRQPDDSHRTLMRLTFKNRCVLKRQRAAMFFDDLLDDGQPQPGTFVARGNIGFKQSRSIFRKPDAIVGDVDFAMGFVPDYRDPNLRIDLIR